MKRIIAVISVVLLLFALAGCGKEKDKKQTQKQNVSSVPSKVKETKTPSTKEEVKNTLGVDFVLPQGGANEQYTKIGDKKAEMTFDYDNMKFTVITKKSKYFEDVSDLNVPWEGTDSCKVKGYSGAVMQRTENGETTQLCIWFDSDRGYNYALYVTAPDLDGFDITAIAQTVYN